MGVVSKKKIAIVGNNSQQFAREAANIEANVTYKHLIGNLISLNKFTYREII